MILPCNACGTCHLCDVCRTDTAVREVYGDGPLPERLARRVEPARVSVASSTLRTCRHLGPKLLGEGGKTRTKDCHG